MIETMKQMVEALEIAAEGGGVDFYAYAKEGRQAIAEAEKQEPVAVVTGVYGGRFTSAPLKASVILPVNMALYAHPQPRKPLTDEE